MSSLFIVLALSIAACFTAGLWEPHTIIIIVHVSDFSRQLWRVAKEDDQDAFGTNSAFSLSLADDIPAFALFWSYART